MNRVVVDKAMLERLAGLPGPIEFCTDEGVTLGYFSPVQEQVRHFDYGLSDEEIRRREQVRTGRPLEDVLADWEKHR